MTVPLEMLVVEGIIRSTAQHPQVGLPLPIRLRQVLSAVRHRHVVKGKIHRPGKDNLGNRAIKPIVRDAIAMTILRDRAVVKVATGRIGPAHKAGRGRALIVNHREDREG